MQQDIRTSFDEAHEILDRNSMVLATYCGNVQKRFRVPAPKVFEPGRKKARLGLEKSQPQHSVQAVENNPISIPMDLQKIRFERESTYCGQRVLLEVPQKSVLA